MSGLLGSAVLNEAARSGLSVTLNGTTTVTSAGLFLASDVGREFSVSSSGILSDTTVAGFTDSSTITLSAAATASGARTATIGARCYDQANQATLDPIAAKLDATNFVVNITTGSTGKILVIFSCNEIGYPSTSADTYLEWSILDNASTVIAPNSAGGVGRRVLLSQSLARRAKMEFEVDLTPNTAYTLFWGSCCGNQVEGVGAGSGYRIRIGGTRGPGVMEVWDLS